jgi:hypothetical protein
MGASVAACAAFIFYERSPPNTFNPLCTYDFAFRETVTLEVGGRQYTSEAVNQLTRSAHWIEGLNSRGCPQLRGTMLSFRLADNRLILIGMGMCLKAFQTFETMDRNYDREAMRAHRKVDIAAMCFGIHRSNTYDFNGRRIGFDAFLIDNADKPTSWRGFFFRNNVATLSADEDVRIISAVAEADDAAPDDQLDTVAPAVLKTNFASPVSDTPILPERAENSQFVALKDPRSDADRLRLQSEGGSAR